MLQIAALFIACSLAWLLVARNRVDCDQTPQGAEDMKASVARLKQLRQDGP